METEHKLTSEWRGYKTIHTDLQQQQKLTDQPYLKLHYHITPNRYNIKVGPSFVLTYLYRVHSNFGK